MRTISTTIASLRHPNVKDPAVVQRPRYILKWPICFSSKSLYWFIHSILQKVDYAKLLDGSDEESNDKPFSSDEEDDLLDNTGIKEASMHQANLDESDNLFDSLKEEESPKPKPKPRKLGAKPEVVKDSSTKAAKRSKKNIGSDDDSPIKVNNNEIPNYEIPICEIFIQFPV